MCRDGDCHLIMLNWYMQQHAKYFLQMKENRIINSHNNNQCFLNIISFVEKDIV